MPCANLCLQICLGHSESIVDTAAEQGAWLAWSCQGMTQGDPRTSACAQQQGDDDKCHWASGKYE